MKRTIILLLVLFNIIFANNDQLSKGKFNLGLLGGINSQKHSELGGIALIEFGYNINENISFGTSVGYMKTTQLFSQIMKYSGQVIIETDTIYSASEYEYLKKNFTIFPFSLGIKYYINNKSFFPYMSLDFNYNYITSIYDRKERQVLNYNSFDEIPAEFKTGESIELPGSSIGFTVGVGSLIRIAQRLNLDFRYFYKYDTEIIDTHQFLIGINF